MRSYSDQSESALKASLSVHFLIGLSMSTPVKPGSEAMGLPCWENFPKLKKTCQLVCESKSMVWGHGTVNCKANFS